MIVILLRDDPSNDVLIILYNELYNELFIVNSYRESQLVIEFDKNRNDLKRKYIDEML